MTFSLDDHWVWDFWIADDGELFHLYYLHAPTSLGDPNLRHRNAIIGHATSADLVTWSDLGPVIGPRRAGDADATAAWTGSVVKDHRDRWRMFYTGSRFLHADRNTNVESILSASSTDLHQWTTSPASIAPIDARWYEVLGDGTWHEQAWRDPWVMPDPNGSGWHMLITARARSGPSADPRDRGVIGHAQSDDLVNWRVLPPMSDPGSGFAHLEVVQWCVIDDRAVALFSCDTAHLAGDRARDALGGVWAAPAPAWGEQIDVAAASRLTGDDLYAGRAVRSRDGRWNLMGFENIGVNGAFVGRISNPLPLQWTPDGELSVVGQEAT
jgi:beta-fructofuranosidase